MSLGGRLCLLLASGLGAGYLPLAPGTWGTLVAVPLYLALARLPALSYLAAGLVFVALAVAAAGKAERLSGRKDPGFVVIDEMAGFLVAMALIPFGWGTLAAGFVLFRLLDVLKPPPVRAVERLGGGLGIVGDDLVAGLYANLALRLLTAGLHWDGR